ncbi:tail completion protein gp17 [Diaphorobacter caeni]|uniref:tail completion protein gp17 n=1 Tax=Diaphorobacter caeni TaxID=2784387 RepID=UPI00188FD958|nr:DUF3168 domain-containing protein [Diaphorobacter caeni]MBF5006006.1 DUF3168 domain-containing protein [Diaphorobacter caeni]
MLEQKLIDALHTVLPKGQVFADVARAQTIAPWAVYQQIGGKSPTSLDQKLINKRNGVFQVTVWAATRPDAVAKALLIEQAIMNSTLQVVPQGSMRAIYEDDTKLYGAMQDFDIWDDR